MAVKPVPDGYHTVTPYLVCTNAAKVIDFAKAAFGAEELFRIDAPGGKIGHAELKIGDSMVMIADEGEGHPAMPAMLNLYVPDADAVFGRAVKAGATVVRELADQFYGDRSGGVKDAAGNQWWISTHVEDVSPEEMERRAKSQKG